MVVCAAARVFLLLGTGVSSKTGFSATAPAGAAEMANIAARYGGEPEPIMVAQTMRVVLAVMAAPFLVIHFANDGQLREIAQVAVMSWPSLALLAACAAVGRVVLARTPYPHRLG